MSPHVVRDAPRRFFKSLAQGLTVTFRALGFVAAAAISQTNSTLHVTC